MTTALRPAGRPMLIGSQPLTDHGQATDLVLAHVPEIPNWVQLPKFKQEGMVAQFAAGLPGLVQGSERTYLDTAKDGFDDEVVAFFEEYLAVLEERTSWKEGRFALTPQLAKGFFTLVEALAGRTDALYAVKGQITGPITFCTSLTDQDRRAIFYNDMLRDAAVKTIALKAAWQVKHLSALGAPVILFIDEPALAGYGSSEFISISKEDITACLNEVIEAVHGHGASAGVHVCANTDWSLLLRPEVDIVNFDAYGYMDKFILYADQIRSFVHAGGCLAWGLVPTLQSDQVEDANLEGLWELWQACLDRMAVLGIDREVLKQQSFITPSCGTGALSPALSRKVLALTQALSSRVQAS